MNYDFGRLRQRTFAETLRLDCGRLGLEASKVRVERVPHPEKRAHWLWQVSYPGRGTSQAYNKDDAWALFKKAFKKRR